MSNISSSALQTLKHIMIFLTDFVAWQLSWLYGIIYLRATLLQKSVIPLVVV